MEILNIKDTSYPSNIDLSLNSENLSIDHSDDLINSIIDKIKLITEFQLHDINDDFFEYNKF